MGPGWGARGATLARYRVIRMSGPADPQHRADLPSGHPLEAQEIESTLQRLEAIAQKAIARRGIPRRADLRPDSVAQSVVARALSNPPNARDREHVLAVLALAVEHKITDRLRRGGKAGREKCDADRSTPLPDATAPDEIRADPEEEGAIARFQAIGSRAIESVETWRLVEMHILRGMRLRDASASLSISRDAGKARYHSARGAVLAALMAPVLKALDAADAEVADAILSRCHDVESAAEELGRAPADIRQTLKEVVVPALLAAYGRGGTSAITTLARGRAR